MGFAIAEECLRRGANVTLIAGPVNLSCSEGIRRIDVESCEEMYEAALKVSLIQTLLYWLLQWLTSNLNSSVTGK